MITARKEKAIKALHILPELRTEEDIEKIYEVTKHVEFFNNILKDDEQLHRACCKMMTFEEFLSGDIIVNYGDLAEKFYIVIRGSLAVYVPIVNENSDLPHKLDEMKEVKIINQGEYFGELALIRGVPRAATIKAKNDCLLAVLTKNDFKKTLSQTTEEKINEKVAALQRIPILSSISIIELQRLSYYFHEIKSSRNQFLYRENKPADCLYFVRSGEFKLIKADLKENSKTIYKDFTSLEKKFKWNKRLKLNPNLGLQIVIKGQNECLGYEEMIERSQFYRYSCSCISIIGSLFSISFNDFRQRIKFPSS